VSEKNALAVSIGVLGGLFGIASETLAGVLTSSRAVSPDPSRVPAPAPSSPKERSA
jgi:hypothetical protein